VRHSRYVAQAGVIAAVYSAFTILVLQLPGGIGWGPVQLRLSEAITVVAALTPAAIPGLTLGTAVANASLLLALGNPIVLYDVVLGSIATLLGAFWTWRFRNKTALALLGPVVFNALIVPAYLPIILSEVAGFYEVPILGVDLKGQWLGMYLFGVVAVGVGQAIVVYGLGWPLLAAMRRIGVAGMAGDGES